MSRELLLFLKSIWYGALLVLNYDLFKISRDVVKHKTVVMAFEDLCYWIFCAVFLFAQYFQENSGMLRGYLGAGVLIGSLSCYVSISPYFVRVSCFLLKKVLKVLQLPANIVKKVIKRLKSRLFRVKLIARSKSEKHKEATDVKGESEVAEKGYNSYSLNNKGESDGKKKKHRRKKPGKSAETSE